MDKHSWIEEYKTEDGLEYRIPEYKIHRIIRQYKTLEMVRKVLEEMIANNSTQGITRLIIVALLKEIEES